MHKKEESSSAEEDEVEGENNSDQDQTSNSCSENGEISKSGEVKEKEKPRATISVKKSSKNRKVSKNILSGEEVEELCERKCTLKIEKFTDVCMTGGIMHTPSHTNVCKFYNFQLTFSQLIFHLKC